VAWGAASVTAMSRTLRRRRGGAAGTGGWLARTAIGLIVVCLLAAGLLCVAVRGYLHSEAFRRLLSEKAGAVAGVTGKFTPFRWDGMAVDADAFHATGQGIVRELRLDGLHTEVGIGGLRRGVWEIRDTRVRRVGISLDATKQSASAAALLAKPAETRSSQTPHKKQKWPPRKVELQGMEIGEMIVQAQLDEGPLSISGMRVILQPDGGKQSHRVELADGEIQIPIRPLPVIRLDQARLRHQDGAVFLTSLSASAWSGGLITASGEWDRETRRFALQGGVSGVKCEEVLSETWAKRLIGEISTDFSADNHSGKSSARGHLVLRNGTLTALPVLDALAAYADTRRFRMLSLSEAHADWRWEKDLIELNEIVLASEGLARLEGRVLIRGRELDGMLRLGLVPGALASIPGAESHVLQPGERGMLWAPVRVTGTIDKPKEDLTDRLILAAGLRMLEKLPESADEVVNLARSLLGQEPAQAVEKAAKAIEKSGLDVREVSGLLDQLLGGGGRKPGEPEPPTKREEP